MRGIEHWVEDVDKFAEPFEILAFGTKGVPYRKTKNTDPDFCVGCLPGLFQKTGDRIDT